MRKKTVRDIDVRGKRVLVRVDFNVPLNPETHGILDDTRIKAALPTIEYLRSQGARVILCSHLGRPDRKVVEGLRLGPVARRLAELIEAPVATAEDCVGPLAEAAAAALQPREVLLLEKEIDHLQRALNSPERPFAAVIGGAKISSKIGVLRNLLGKVDGLLLGGGMASTFLKSRGFAVGDSLVEDDQLEEAQRILADAEARGVPLLLPTDVVVADRFAADAGCHAVAVRNIPEGWRILDIGADTLTTFRDALDDCKTVLWNGPMGVAEFAQFSEGSLGLALAMAELDAVTIVGGGETVALIQQAGLEDRFTHVSTGGGASLEFLEGRQLPGIAALM